MCAWVLEGPLLITFHLIFTEKYIFFGFPERSFVIRFSNIT